jgi:YD repeat-containing protein
VICYDASGNLASVTSPEGVTLSASQLGVEVLRGTDGALRQIYSLADGLLDIVTLDETHYEIRWYKVGDFAGKNAEGLYVPTDSPIKVFECGAPAGTTGVFEITERRGTAFAFTNRWEFDASANEWVFSRGNDYTSTRAWTVLENGNFAVTETVSNGADSSTTEELISPTNGNRYVGKTVDGVAEYTATRVTSGNGLGKVATETDRSGATRCYDYDTHGRVIKETLSSGFGGLLEPVQFILGGRALGLGGGGGMRQGSANGAGLVRFQSLRQNARLLTDIQVELPGIGLACFSVSIEGSFTGFLIFS